MYIQDDVVDEVRSKVNLVEVAQDYLTLRRSGQNYKALCPFHKEKTPSFVINPVKGIFHCFGCGTGGNVFSFIMKMEKVGFQEAVRMLAGRCGVDLPVSLKMVDQGKESLYKINELAQDLFHDHLLSKDGEVALRYLLDRGLRMETIITFKLGYAPKGWGWIRDSLLSKGIALEDMEKCGLLIHKEGKDSKERVDYYDRFRQRIIFPILDIRGRVVGFGARALGEEEPKYLNSPETPIYTKGAILYGMSIAKWSIQDKGEAIIVEGYMDVLLAHQYGFNNVVGTCGTALTQDHARLLKRYAKDVIIMYDPDLPGREATLRGLETLLEEGLGVRVVELPNGYDPADLILNKGEGAFRESILVARDLFDYRLRVLLDGVDPSSVVGKRKVVEGILPIITKVSDSIQRTTYIKMVAELLHIDEGIIYGELRRLKGKGYHVDIMEYLESNTKGAIQCERSLIGLLLNDEGVQRELWDEILLAEFIDPLSQRILCVVRDLGKVEGGIDTLKLLDLLDEEGRGFVSSLVLEDHKNKDNLSLARAYLRRMKGYSIDRKINDLRGRIDSAKDEELKELLVQYQNLIKERQEVLR